MRSVRSAVRWRSSLRSRVVFDSDDRLVREVSTNLICFSLNGRTGARCRTNRPISYPLSNKRHSEDCTKVPQSCELTEGVFVYHQEHLEFGRICPPRELGRLHRCVPV